MSTDVVQAVFADPEAVVEAVKGRRGRPAKAKKTDDVALEVKEEKGEVSEISVAELADAGNIDIVDDVVEDNPELQEFRESVKDKIKNLRDSFWYVAEAFVRVRNEKLFKTWGFRSFEAYLEEECEYSRSSAFLLMKTYTYFKDELKDRLSECSESYDQLVSVVKEVGWAKASKLAQEQVITPETVDEILEALKTLTVSALEAKCKNIVSTLPEDVQEDLRESNDMKTVKKNFQLTLHELDVVENAIKKAKTFLREGAKDSKALAFICGEYDSSNIAAAGEDNMGDYLYKLERLLGIDLIAVSQNGEKILYGQDTVKRLAGETSTTETESEDSEMIG